MSDTNSIIAEWVGENGFKYTPDKIARNYVGSNSVAISLLPVLVARGYTSIDLSHEEEKKIWLCNIYVNLNDDSVARLESKWHWIDGGGGKTISEAICNTLLELMEKENLK